MSKGREEWSESYFLCWMRHLPHDQPVHQQSESILQEMRRCVLPPQKPLPWVDTALLCLQRLRASPLDPALKQLGHIQKGRHREVMHKSRRFQKSAATTSGAFF